MNCISPFIEEQGYVQLDGGLSTELEHHGANLDHDLWSAVLLDSEPERLFDAHLAYFRAGADIVASASYQASFEGFAQAGYSSREAELLMRLSIELAGNARDEYLGSNDAAERTRPLVAASLGPYGAYLADGSEYHGNYGISAQVLRDFHRPRLELMADTSADLVAFETIPSMQEADVILDLLESISGIQAWISFSCRDGKSISHGEAFSDAMALANQSSRLVSAGINCTAPEYVESLLETVADSKLPLMSYPNSGESWNAAEHEWSGSACSVFPLERWYDRGAVLLGGCCRTRSEDIPAMRQQMTEYIELKQNP